MSKALRARLVQNIAMLAIGGGFLISQPMGTAADEPMVYSIEVGDQLQVSVQGEENASAVLSGQFRVEPDGAIQYPLLGRVKVAGLGPEEVVQLLVRSLSSQVRIGMPTISVVEFAPVYVVGEVMRSGSFQFKPEMTVLELILEAGGLSHPETSERVRLDLLEDRSRLTLNQHSLEIHRARLLAELNDAAFDTPVGTRMAQTANIVAAETSILNARRRARATRGRSYDAQRDGYDQEIVSLEQSILLHDEEVRLLEEQLSVQEDLSERGLTAHSARRDAQRQLMSSRREGLEFKTALYRAKQNRLAVDQALAEAETRVKEENVRDLREVEVAIEQNRIALASTTAKFEQFESDSVVQTAWGRTPSYLLIRLVDGEFQSRAVDEQTKLKRGDILRVAFHTSAPQGEIRSRSGADY